MGKLKHWLQCWLLEPEYHVWEAWKINSLRNYTDEQGEFLFTRIWQERKCKLCGKTDVYHEDSNKA